MNSLFLPCSLLLFSLHIYHAIPKPVQSCLVWKVSIYIFTFSSMGGIAGWVHGSISAEMHEWDEHCTAMVDILLDPIFCQAIQGLQYWSRRSWVALSLWETFNLTLKAWLKMHHLDPTLPLIPSSLDPHDELTLIESKMVCVQSWKLAFREY